MATDAGDRAEGQSKRPVRLGDRLLELGLITADQLDIALAEQRRDRRFVGEILADLGFVDRSVMTAVLAEMSGVSRFDASSTIVDPDAAALVPKTVAQQSQAAPYLIADGALHVAMVDPQDVIALDALRRHMPADLDIRPHLCTALELTELLDRAYDYAMSIDGILNELETGEIDLAAALDASSGNFRHPLVRLVDAVLFDAVKQGASDIHFEPEEYSMRLRYRIDGHMRQIRNFQREHISPISHRIKLLAHMNIADKLTAQDGRFHVNMGKRQIDFRVSSLPSVYGENLVLRILDQSSNLLSLDQLGLLPVNRAVIDKILKRPEGVIIATGPTGSGKTTLLYSMLAAISSIKINVMTLEDPVEYKMPLIRQTQIHEGVGLGFAAGVRALLRQDPDVILIGEIRDEDTAQMAMRAAMTGHKVFSTLHTNDSFGAVSRLIDLGLQPSVIAGNTIAVIAQRLARRLCPACKQKRKATEEEARILGVDIAEEPEIWEAEGCETCDGTGSKGRCGLLEILVFDDVIDELVGKNASRADLKAGARANGFRSIADDGVDRVLRGEISLPMLISTVNVTDRL